MCLTKYCFIKNQTLHLEVLYFDSGILSNINTISTGFRLLRNKKVVSENLAKNLMVLLKYFLNYLLFYNTQLPFIIRS